MVELRSGVITIDGVDVSQVGLDDLRSNMAIIPQDPQLFSGTIRSNLDPVSLEVAKGEFSILTPFSFTVFAIR
jgi:ABC-type multidrug transport system fused ATPase/permease subunit